MKDYLTRILIKIGYIFLLIIYINIKYNYYIICYINQQTY